MLKKPLLIMMLCTILSANDLIEIYQKYGIEAVEQEILKILKKRNQNIETKQVLKDLKDVAYWEERLKDEDTRFGYYESSKYLLITNKNRQEFRFFKKVGNRWQQDSKVNALVGKEKGSKQKRGDLKTPTGVYNLVQKITKLDQFYGPLAFVTNYPNLYDGLKGKNGDGIWIHGMPLNGDRQDNTKGCIALDNRYLIELDREIEYQKATLIIWDDDPKEAKKSDIALILANLHRWLEAWRNNDIERYLSFYDKDFRRFDGRDIKWFEMYKRRVFSKNEKKRIELNNFDIAPYPNDENINLYRVNFYEIYKSPSYSFEGKKELYVKVDRGRFSIMVEQ